MEFATQLALTSPLITKDTVFTNGKNNAFPYGIHTMQYK